MPKKKVNEIAIGVIECKKCKQFIWSRHRHDFRECKCGSYFIDGGRDYVRIGGPDVAVSDAQLKKEKRERSYKYHTLKIPKSYADLTFVDFGKMCMEINKKNGWPVASWDSKTDIPVKISLLHSEVSEALESFRHNDFCEYMEEMADIFVRSFDQSAPLNSENFDSAFTMLAFELYVKIQVNLLRGFRHGNKRA